MKKLALQLAVLATAAIAFATPLMANMGPGP